MALAIAQAPPRVPRSRILRSHTLQTNGCTSGTPNSLAWKLVYDQPAIWPSSLMSIAALSGPPRVPRSNLPWPHHRVAWVSVVPGKKNVFWANVAQFDCAPAIGLHRQAGIGELPDAGAPHASRGCHGRAHAR